MINIGKYIEIAINWLTEHFARFFDVINDGVGGFIDAFQDGLTWIPFYVMILGLALLAWFKAGKGVGVFTALGLLLIYGMGFWVETMQTLALVLSSTIIALMIGVPLGIWTARSDRADKIIHPVLVKGLKNSSAVKNELSKVNTYEELEKILKDYEQFLDTL